MASRLADGSVPHRQEGGTKLNEEDLVSAFEVLNPGGSSVVTKSQLLASLKMFFPNISAREVRELVGPGNLTIEKLQKLLFETPLMPDCDANAEAFKILDTYRTGFADMNTLRRLLLQLPGVDTIDDDDMLFLFKLIDKDGDGRISLEDFAVIGTWKPDLEVPSDAVKSILSARMQRG